MFNSTFSFSELSEYYEDKLLVKTVSGSRMTALAAGAATHAFGDVLASLQRDGVVTSVTSVATEVASAQEEYLSVAVGSSFTGDAAEEPASEISLVQIRSGSDLKRVQRELKKDLAVEYVERVPVRYLCSQTVAAIPPERSNLWNLKRIRWQESVDSGIKQANDITVAVLDTGVQEDHPGLRGTIASYDYKHPIPEVMNEQDYSGHGTHVAGVIGGLASNGFGLTGICECKLRIWKIFGDQTRFLAGQNVFGYVVDPVAYLRALRACAREAVDVLNLSIGGPGKPSPEEQTAIDELIGKGTVVVAAMGNERTFASPTSYPAAVPGVIAVGATNVTDNVTSFSSRGGHISLCAPGQAIWSTLPTYPGQFGFLPKYVGRKADPDLKKPIAREVDYDAWNGTSMAAPHVAGAVALMLANRGKDSPARVQEALQKSADHVPGMVSGKKDPDYGAGRLNLFKLLQ